MTDTDAEQLLTLASGCETAVRRYLAYLAQLEADLNTLAGQTCNGQPWWRDREHPGRKGKLYIIHSPGQACPMHGTPPPGGRLRVYIGSDPARIAQALDSVERAASWRALQERRKDLQQRLASSIYYLHGFYIVLGCPAGLQSGAGNAGAV